MSFKIVDKIRSRSREEWSELVKSKWIDLRIFVQENGELGFIAAFVLGIVFILFFKLVITVLILCFLAGFLVWNIAEPRKEQPGTEPAAPKMNVHPKDPFDDDPENRQTH